jgi:aminoglycoside phosphotransferase
VTRRRGRRRKQLLDDLGDRRGYAHLKEEALDRIKWRNRFGRGCGPVVWQITDDDDWLLTCRVSDRVLMMMI